MNQRPAHATASPDEASVLTKAVTRAATLLGDELAECGEGQREYAAVCGSVTGAGRAGGRGIG